VSPSTRQRWRLKWRLRFLDITRPSGLEATLLWAGLVGLAGGAAGVLFRELIALLHWIFTAHHGDVVATARDLPTWQRMLVPAAGGVLAGMVLHFGVRMAERRAAGGTTDFMEAIAIGDGVLRVRASLVRCSSSLVTLASGGSIGREGPMTLASALVGSLLGRALRLSTPQLRLLLACGAAAGIASAYKAPIAGALFVAEIVLGSIAMQSFGPLIFSSVVATLVSRYASDGRPIFDVPPFQILTLWELPLYVLLGISAGIAAPWFLRAIRVSERIFRKIPGPAFVRLAAGGLVVGVLSMVSPEVWGNGYSAVSTILRAEVIWYVVLQVLLMKVVATAASVGSGAVGGVFTPTLFVGATLGFLFGQLAQSIFPGLIGAPHAYALVGMGCVLAGTTHAPLMAILMIFEMTLTYEVVLPLMLACVTSYYASHRINPKGVYAESLRRRAEEMEPMPPPALLHVSDLMRAGPPRVHGATSFEAIADAFSGTNAPELYVVAEDERLLGVITGAEIKPHLDDPALADVVIASDLMRRDVPALTPTATLHEAMERLRGHDGKVLPVVDGVTRRLLGTISTNDVLLTLAHGSSAPRARA
jgi:CIC family chloride channel protein